MIYFIYNYARNELESHEMSLRIQRVSLRVAASEQILPSQNSQIHLRPILFENSVYPL